jgi:MFS transporter, DHA1 family, multidrug resistance protein
MNHQIRMLFGSMAEPYQSSDILCIPYLDKAGQVNFATDDIENPKIWSTARRWYITIAAVVLVVNASYASSSPSGCIPSISEDLHVSEEVAGLVITLFLLGYCAGPLIFAPLSEFYGEHLIFPARKNRLCYLR